MRGIATIVLAAGCWAVWEYSPVLLAFLGLDDLDIPGRVCAVFLFLSAVEVTNKRIRRM
jgi:small neutral amino acid transporter SnatA (MarC family)